MQWAGRLRQFCVGTADLGGPGDAARLGFCLSIHTFKSVSGLRPADSRGRLSLRKGEITAQTYLANSRDARLGTIVRCGNLPCLLVILRSTPAPASIMIFRKLKPGRTSFQGTRLLWMIPNSPLSVRRPAYRTLATS